MLTACQSHWPKTATTCASSPWQHLELLKTRLLPAYGLFGQMLICHGSPKMMRSDLYLRATTTSPRCSRNLTIGIQMLCTLTIGVRPGLVSLSQLCARLRWSPRFIQLKVDGTVAMFPRVIPPQFILLNHGLPMFRSASFAVRDLCNAR